MAFRFRRTLDVFFCLQVVYEPFEHGVRLSACELDGTEFVAGKAAGIFLFQLVGAGQWKSSTFNEV